MRTTIATCLDPIVCNLHSVFPPEGSDSLPTAVIVQDVLVRLEVRVQTVFELFVVFMRLKRN